MLVACQETVAPRNPERRRLTPTVLQSVAKFGKKSVTRMSFFSEHKLLRKLTQSVGRSGKATEPVPVIHLASSADLGRALFWASPSPVFLLPPHLLVFQGGQPYTPEHPFIQALSQGPVALERFYGSFAPADLAAMYRIAPTGLAGEDLPPWELPWLARKRRPPRGEAGLGPEHGTSFYGPCSATKIALEYSRLAELRRSITEEGYLPDTYEHIEGHFFRRGQEFRFFVRGGKHRAAVLAFLGHELIPVRVRASWPRAIEVGQQQDWPLVASGELDVKLARGIFEKYFDHE